MVVLFTLTEIPMSQKPQMFDAVPAATTQVTKAAFPQGTGSASALSL